MDAKEVGLTIPVPLLGAAALILIFGALSSAVIELRGYDSPSSITTGIYGIMFSLIAVVITYLWADSRPSLVAKVTWVVIWIACLASCFLAGTGSYLYFFC